MNANPQIDPGNAAAPPPSALTVLSAAAATVAAAVLLLDAAAETFWSGSPLRWWVAPSIIGFVALSAWLWKPGETAAKRWGWGGAAAWTIGGLLLLLAASSWLPGGQIDGVRMLRQPTSAVLTMATAAAVLLAVVVLFQALSVLPSTVRLAARALLAALAIYALASLGFALVERAPFAALFQGGAAWQRLPRWLQGAFVGAFALMPVALLGQVIRFVDHLRRKQPVRVLLHQATALVMAIVMAASGVVLPTATGAATRTAAPGATTGAMPTAASSAASSAAPEATAAAAAVPLEVLRTDWTGGQDPQRFAERLFTVAEAEMRRPGADPSDVTAKAASLGHDSQKIFALLRDKIVLEPYVGMLRGARGTLAAGAGNALDRALLAQALLKAGGTDSRLVAGALSNDRADALLNRFLAFDPIGGALATVAATPEQAGLEALSKEVADRIGLSPGKAQELLHRASEQTDAFWRATDAQRRSHMDFLGGQLQKAGVKAADGTDVSARVLRERLTRHYWIQVKDGTGAWKDFDPSFPEAQPGVAYADAAAPLREIPRDAVHRFELSLVYRTTVRGALKREVVLKGEAAAADALFGPMAFQIQPAGPTPDVGALAGMAAGEKIAVLKKLKRFQGILQVGSRVIAGREFDLEGRTYEAASGGPSGQAVSGMFGGLLGGGGDGGPTPGEFVDLQLVLRLSGPGRQPITQTRTLARAADVKAPGFAPPLIWSEILVQPQWIPADLVSYQVLQSLVGFRPMAAEALEASRLGRPARLPSQPIPPFPQHLLPLALLRQRAAAGILREQAGVRSLVDAPLLTMANLRVSDVNADSATIRLQRSIDIVANAVRYVGPDGNASQDTFDAALRQGVADSTLEAQFLPATYPEDATGSGAAVFERAGLERRPVFVAGPQEADTLRRAGLGDRDVQWIGENEDPSYRVVVTTTVDGAAGWWSVGPDGTTILRVSGGWGQAHAEHDAMVTGLKIVSFAHCGWELHHGSHHPSTATGWGMFSCVALAGVSGFFMMAGIHSAAAITGLFTVEILNVVGTAIMADRERVHVIDLRK
jgi:hypothetical protein